MVQRQPQLDFIGGLSGHYPFGLGESCDLQNSYRALAAPVSALNWMSSSSITTHNTDNCSPTHGMAR
jgi:hypothetical protein